MPGSAEVVSESALGLPAPALRHLVAFYVGYRQAGLAPGLHRGLPSPFLTVVLTLDDPLDVVAHADARQRPESYTALVGGLHTRPVLLSHPGRQSGVQLALWPLGARELLGLPAGELAGLDLDAADVLGPLAGRLRERLLAAATWPQRFAVLDAALLGAARERPGPAPEVHRAWRWLLESRGTLPVTGLARDVGWSERHLAARFRAEVGLTPKAAARVVRFDRARRLLARRVSAGGAPQLAELAAVAGYYDQAHLAREFRELAGCAPTRWLAEEVGSVQADAATGPPDFPA